MLQPKLQISLHLGFYSELKIKENLGGKLYKGIDLVKKIHWSMI